MYALVDSNVILDILTNDPNWSQWSIDTLAKVSDRFELAINPIIYAELSVGFQKIEDLDEALVLFKRCSRCICGCRPCIMCVPCVWRRFGASFWIPEDQTLIL